MDWKHSISTKVIASTVLAIVAVVAVTFAYFTGTSREEAEALLEQRAAAFVSVADANKEQAAELHDSDVFRIEELEDEVRQIVADGGDYRTSRFYKTVPIVAAWTTARKAAEKKGLDFRITSFEARDENNDPAKDAISGAFRSQLLKDLTAQVESGGSQELSRIDDQTNSLHYMHAIRLGNSCMACHGDPATSPTGDGLDITGHRMEDWSPGKMHGAYEVVMPMDECDAKVAGVIGSALLWLVPMTLLVAVAFSFLLRRNLNKPLSRLHDQLQDIACGEGDLTKRLNIEGADEISQTARWFDSFTDRIHSTVVQVTRSASSADSASQILVDESHRLADRAATNAATIQEINATLEEIRLLAVETHSSCTEANDGAKMASAAADEGNASSTRMEEAMSEIKESSDAVSSIVRVIHDVAFQTNLLALNAAVEAARAGEAGKGFAVVAEEVRNLAKRSAEAATQTEELIGEAAARADRGAHIATDMLAAFETVSNQTAKVGDLLSNLAIGTEEQRAKIELVNGGVTSLSDGTQVNAASAEELAVTARESAREMTELRDLVGKFHVDPKAPTSA